MSIFKEPFKEPIRLQLEARQNAIRKRDATAIKYLNTRSSWVKMTSAVDVNGSPNLAQDYVLFGGTLFFNKPRTGVGTATYNAYSTTTGREDHRLGMRPMPGITGVDIKTKSAYGSLMEATVNFVCWDIKQLEELEILYMRPGYSVLLEWGWAPYLGNDGSIKTTIPFNTSVLAGGKSKEEIWKELYDNTNTSGGNYCAIYGFIKNYSWKARTDGGYDCTTTLITMGELIESLKINWVPVTTDLAFKQGIYKKADSENFKKDGNLNKAYQRNFTAGWIYEMYVIMKDEESISSKTRKVSSTINNSSFYAYEFEVSGDAAKKPEEGSQEPEDFTTEPLNIYIKLGDFIDGLNKYVLLHGGPDGKQKPMVEVSLKEGFQHSSPDTALLCLGHPYQISMDPTVCLLNNPEFASSVSSAGAATGDSDTEDEAEDAGETANEVISGFNGADVFLKEGEDGSKFGIIENIYVNLAFLYKLVTDDGLASQDKKEKKDISLFDFLKNMMNGINISIGNVANFDIHIDPTDSIARIIDVNYVDINSKGSVYAGLVKTPLQIHNTKSTVRSYSLESQIFPEQSATVAIGAQAQGGALGSGDNTLVDFNQNLTDRIIPRKDIAAATDTTTSDTEKLTNLKTNLTTIAEYFSALDDGTVLSRFFGGGGEFDKSKASQYTNALKDIISYTKTLTDDKTNNRSIIPTKLSIEMDGIGGIIIGSMFVINDDLLPRGYKGGEVGVNIGYLVTSVGHSIGSDGDWKTNLGAQFFILEGQTKSQASSTSIANAIKAVAKKVERVVKVTQSNETTETSSTNTSDKNPQKPLKTPGPPSKDLPPNLTVDKVIRAMQRKGYSFYAPTVYGTNKLNIVGLRNIDKDIGKTVTNYFTDIMVMFYFDESGTRHERIGRFTSVPGLTYQAKEFYPGTNRVIGMKEGQYIDSYYQGTHIKTPLAMRQGKAIPYRQDKHKNYTYENDGSETANNSTNIHNSKAYQSTDPQKLINNWSAGCQVFRSQADFDWMSQAGLNQINKTKYKLFTYTLMNIRDIEGFEKITEPV
jgi:hypothetical protein